MRTLFIALIASVCWLAPSYGQNSGKSAKEVWAAFEANPSDIYIFLDGLADSDNPQEYRRYIQKFINKCLERGVSFDALLDEMKETVLPKSTDLAATYGASLCVAASSLYRINKVMQIFPKNCSFDDIYVNNAVVFPGGKILLYSKCSSERVGKLNSLLETYVSYYINIKNSDSKKFSKYHDVFYNSIGIGSRCLCQADGSVELGVFKNKISNKLLDNIKDVKNTDDIELYVGEKFNKDCERIGEVCMEFGSFEKAYASINRDLGTATGVNSDLMDKYTAQLKAKLVKKYGTKAYNAMENAHPYVGMPEGILREYGYPTPDNFGNNKFVHAYGFSHTNVSGYKVYKVTIQYLALCNAVHVNTPQYILCSGGKVAAVKW